MRHLCCEPRITAQKRVHSLFITGEDDDDVFATVLHRLKEKLDRFAAVVALVFGPV